MNELKVMTEVPVARMDDSLNTLIETFLSAQDIKASSKGTYEKDLKRFMEWVRERSLSNPAREDILAFKGYVEAQGSSSFTLSTCMVAVRKFSAWTESVKLYPNVARSIKGAKKTRGFRKDPLTADQVKELLNGIDRSTVEGKRNYALLNLLIRTGLRTVEVIRAEVGDIRQESGEAVLWIQGKGRDAKDEFVLLTHETLKPLHEYLQARGRAEDGDSLFASPSDRSWDKRLATRTIREIVKRNLRGIGLDSVRLTAHSLRHTAITLSLMGGATIQKAQALGRHSNINTTLIYAHNIDRIAQGAERKIDALLASAN